MGESHLEGTAGLCGTSKWPMVGEGIHSMLPLPTGATVVLEAVQVTTEIWSHNSVTNTTERVLQVWVNLNLQINRCNSLLPYILN